MAAPLDPPSYSVEDVLRDEHDLLNDHAFRNNALAQSPQPPPSPPLETQLVIAPVHDDMSFQKGYLGVDGEHAAIEGEIQLKVAIGDHDWDRLTVELTTTEITPSGFVELSRTQRELWQRSASASTSTNTGPSRPPAVLPFSLPLMQDAPQCVHTPHSSLEHALTAVLHGGERSLRRTLTVHTRRFASPSDAVLPVAPETRVSDAPTRLEVQIPRLAYRAGEAIPVYVTVPPPSPTLILSEGIRLRNIRAELIQVVRIPKGADENSSAEWTPPEPPQPPPSEAGTVSTDEDEDDEDDDDESSSSEEDMPIEKTALFDDGVEQPDPQTAQHTARVAISGAACRFHRSRSVRIRLVLHPSRTALGPSYGFSDEPPACAHGISQRAVLHSVSYRLVVTAAFLVTTGISSRSERLARISFPVEVLPPPAPTIPEEEPALEGAYRKKHDRPPTRTVRRADAEGAQPEPGPSDPPPPFEGTGDGLPTFLESEAAQGTSSSYHHSSTPDPDAEVDADAGPPEDGALFDGEGVLFGFPAAEQYDGLSLPLEMRRESLPPDLAMLLNARTAGRTGEILMDAPPPPMDDPSDPPPAIDAVSFAAPPAGIRRPSFAAGTLAHPLVAMTMDEPPPTIDASFSTTLEAPPTIDASFTSPPTIDASFAAPRAPPPAIDAASFHAPPAVGVEEAQTPIEPPPYLNRAQQEQRDREAHRDAGPPPYADLVR